jgi:hypothetical protein
MEVLPIERSAVKERKAAWPDGRTDIDGGWMAKT